MIDLVMLNGEMAPDTGCVFVHLWCGVTDRIKALAGKPVGSPSKETPAPAPSLSFTTCYISQDIVELNACLMTLPSST